MKNVVILHGESLSALQDEKMPFRNKYTNQSYRYFLESGKERGIHLVIAHHTDYHDGKVRNCWSRKDNDWQKIDEVPVDYVFDKFPNRDDYTWGIREDVIKRNIPILNHPNLEKIMKDKRSTYECFLDLIPISIPVNGELENIVTSIELLRKMNLHPDLNSERLLIKPRFGYGGRGIVEVNGQEYGVLNQCVNQDYIIQAFLESANGISELNIRRRHDFRVIIINGRPAMSYFRFPKEGGIISNVGSDGDLQLFDVEDIPKRFQEIVEFVDAKLNQYNPRVYSVDMAVGQSKKIWCYELNSKPGIMWGSDEAEDIRRHMFLQDALLDVMASRWMSDKE